jgi:hypothetical protein
VPDLTALFWFVLVVGVVLVLGVGVGILLGRRIDRVVSPPEEPRDPDDTGPPAID